MLWSLSIKNISAQAELPLPIYSTKEEIKNSPNYHVPSPKGITTPPTSQIRNPAEWEEMQGICISWKGYNAFLTEIVKHSVSEGYVWIYCSDSNSVKNTLNSAQVDLTNVRYLIQNTNSVWIRDFGANFVYVNDVDTMFMVDWVYNRSRPLDDTSPVKLASTLGLTMFECTAAPTDLVATGGNFMSDGFGTAFSSKLILDENSTVTSYNSTPKSEQAVRDIVGDFYGIDNYILMETLPYDDIHHIDMHMKLLDEETLLVGYYPTGISDGPQIDSNIAFIQNNYVSVFGTPFKIVRIPMPPSTSGTWPSNGGYYRTYTNSLIINKKVLVPTYYQQYDTTALRIYRQAMPGYEVIGINANDIIPASGTIHCTTHEVAANDPLLISHQRLTDTNDIWNNFEINALIKHKTGILNAKIWYRTDTTQSFTQTTMTLTDSVNNIWTGFIPSQISGKTVNYYIEAQANSGKSQVRPMPAPAAFWSFKVYNNVGIENLDASLVDLKAYPTSKNNLSIDLYASEKMKSRIEIYNIEGQLINVVFNGELNQGRSKIDFKHDMPAGVYLIKLTNDRQSLSRKIIL